MTKVDGEVICIFFTVMLNDEEYAMTLLEQNPDIAKHIDVDDGETPLFAAARFNCARLSERLIAIGCPINHGDYYAYTTALHEAAVYGSTDTVKLLLKHGAEINTQTRLGWTPYNCATNHLHLKTAEVLVSAGCDTTERGM
jgi:ankyrin repeat protein